MEVYFLSGFAAGLVMAGIYLALLLNAPRTPSLTRAALLLIATPFVLPLRVAFHAARAMRGAAGACDSVRSPTRPRH
jgi:hypothetical protein